MWTPVTQSWVPAVKLFGLAAQAGYSLQQIEKVALPTVVEHMELWPRLIALAISRQPESGLFGQRDRRDTSPIHLPEVGGNLPGHFEFIIIFSCKLD